MKFRHKKTGNIYRVIALGIDATNSRDGRHVVVYCPDNGTAVYVRDQSEFDEKFEKIEG